MIIMVQARYCIYYTSAVISLTVQVIVLLECFANKCLPNSTSEKLEISRDWNLQSTESSSWDKSQTTVFTQLNFVVFLP